MIAVDNPRRHHYCTEILMSRLRFVYAVGAALLFTACDSSVATFAEPALPAFAKSSHAIAHSVTGSGRYLSVNGLTTETYNFAVLKDGEGNVKGTIKIVLRSPEVAFVASPICLEVQDNLAWVEGVVTVTSSQVIPIGSPIFFRVRDNGEGENAPPDAISAIFYGPFNAGRCAARFNINNPAYPTPYEFYAGNIQVR